MAEQNVSITPTQLQSLMESVVATAIKAAKEPNAAEQAKLDKEHETNVRKAKEMADLAKVQEQAKTNRWLGCPHYAIYNGRTFHKWNGQVNSNGFVVPICNLCRVEAPPFSAKLLPDEGKQGVNFETWNDASVKTLTMLHQKSFNGKCDKVGCFVCDPKKD